MTTQKKIPEDRGGSTVIKEGEVTRERGTLNPGDQGYAEAIAKAPVESDRHPGTLNRAPSHADLTREPEPKKQPERAHAPSAASSATTKGEK